MIYNCTCDISRQRFISSDGNQMTDACHISPWSQAKDDSIQNDIALTPTFHRTFDWGHITISADYVVSVSDTNTEDANSPFSLKQFEGN